MKKHDMEFIARTAVEHLLKSELGDYSHFEKWEYDSIETSDDEVYIYIEFTEAKHNGLRFKVDPKKIDTDDKDDFYGEIEVEMGEDTYETIVTYDWRIKYFWMALLNWN